jgi:hypothetical protein
MEIIKKAINWHIGSEVTEMISGNFEITASHALAMCENAVGAINSKWLPLQFVPLPCLMELDQCVFDGTTLAIGKAISKITCRWGFNGINVLNEDAMMITVQAAVGATYSPIEVMSEVTGKVKKREDITWVSGQAERNSSLGICLAIPVMGAENGVADANKIGGQRVGVNGGFGANCTRNWQEASARRLIEGMSGTGTSNLESKVKAHSKRVAEETKSDMIRVSDGSIYPVDSNWSTFFLTTTGKGQNVAKRGKKRALEESTDMDGVVTE